MAFAGAQTAFSTISTLYVNNTFTYAGMTLLTDNPDSYPSTGYYAIIPSDQNYAALHSTLMAAQASNKSTAFYVSGCANGYPHILSIIVKTQ